MNIFDTENPSRYSVDINMERVRMKIKGKVQGVFFRASTREAAERYGIKGWVKNMSDGTVETVAEGEKDAIEKFIDWCRKGPADARVTDIDIVRQSPTGQFKDFSIKHS